jgi:type I restriction enzyme S subunit
MPSERLGAYFRSRRERGKAGLPTMSVTLDRGLVLRDSIERKMETNLTPDEHLKVYPGDIAYNMMRMWQGASGMAETEGIVSPAYVVLAPKPNVDPLFASYLFKTKEMIHRFWAFSYGLTDDRLRLYPRDFTLIPASLPSLPEQQKIAEILSTWDKAIQTTEALLANARTQKRALMQYLLTGTRRFPGFEDHPWREVRLDDLASVERGKFSARPRNDPKYFGGSIPFVQTGDISQSDLFLNSHSQTLNEEGLSVSRIFPAGTILMTIAANIGDVAMAQYPVACPDSVVGILPNLNQTNPMWLLQKLILEKDGLDRSAPKLAQKNINLERLRPLRLLAPSLHEQTKIGEVLGASDTEIRSMIQTLACLRIEKKSLIQQLLTGKRRVAV